MLTIPTASICAEALPRDRTHIDPEAMETLKLSIMNDGLRQPIEVWRYSTPVTAEDGTIWEYALISGHRRLTAHQMLAASRRNGDFTTIAAFIRQPASIPEAMAAMAAENEIRADISPWEKARLLLAAVGEEIFPTPDAAIATLHRHATPVQKSRLRAVVSVVEVLDEVLRDPQTYSLRQLLRLASALRAGFGELILTTLYTTEDKSPAAQWSALQNVLLEAEAYARDPEPPTIPGRPRRVLYPRSGLTVRRERTHNGWSLHFTGEEAHGMVLDSVMDAIERMYGPP